MVGGGKRTHTKSYSHSSHPAVYRQQARLHLAWLQPLLLGHCCCSWLCFHPSCPPLLQTPFSLPVTGLCCFLLSLSPGSLLLLQATCQPWADLFLKYWRAIAYYCQWACRQEPVQQAVLPHHTYPVGKIKKSQVKILEFTFSVHWCSTFW